MMMRLRFSLGLVVLLGLSACAPSVPAPAGGTAGSGGAPEAPKTVTTASGLQYIDTKLGDGAEAKTGQRVSVHYTGTLDDGKKFDSSKDRNQPFDFQLGAGMVIKGWDEGVAGMKVGGSRKLIIPMELAYGPQGRPPTIPPAARLTFEVDLLAIK